MRDKGRLPVYVLIFTALILAIAKAKRHNYNTNKNKYVISTNQHAPFLGNTNFIYDTCKTDEKIANATNRIRDFTLALVFVGLLSAGISCFQWNAIWGQLQVMLRDERPLVGAPSFEPVSDGAGIYHFRLGFKNVGKTLAANIDILTQPVDSSWQNEGEFLCRKALKDTKKRPNVNSIVPGDTFFIEEAKDAINTRIDFGKFKSFNGMNDPHIVGCIIYKSTLEVEYFQTAFVAYAAFDKASGKIAVPRVWSFGTK